MDEQFIQKLMLSKAIMDKTEGTKRNSQPQRDYYEDDNEGYGSPQPKYNIPQEYLSEQPQQQQPMYTSNPTKPVGAPTVDAIKSSKLPDEIKRLMIEHPISQPQQSVNTTLSDEVIEKATRLMRGDKSNYIPESAKPQPKKVEKIESGIDYGKIQKMIESAVNKALKENGMLVESTEKSNDLFTFRVGKHVFEGKVTKIKKIS
jgi:hypothetical protein